MYVNNDDNKFKAQALEVRSVDEPDPNTIKSLSVKTLPLSWSKQQKKQGKNNECQCFYCNNKQFLPGTSPLNPPWSITVASVGMGTSLALLLRLACLLFTRQLIRLASISNRLRRAAAVLCMAATRLAFDGLEVSVKRMLETLYRRSILVHTNRHEHFFLTLSIYFWIIFHWTFIFLVRHKQMVE